MSRRSISLQAYYALCKLWLVWGRLWRSRRWRPWFLRACQRVGTQYLELVVQLILSNSYPYLKALRWLLTFQWIIIIAMLSGTQKAKLSLQIVRRKCRCEWAWPVDCWLKTCSNSSNLSFILQKDHYLKIQSSPSSHRRCMIGIRERSQWIRHDNYFWDSYCIDKLAEICCGGSSHRTVCQEEIDNLN